MIGKKVMVTTSYRGVFFGTLKTEDGTTVVIENARNCVYWSSDVRGFVGLAVSGPSKNCKVGPAAPEMKIHNVTAVTAVSGVAAEKWEASPWA